MSLNFNQHIPQSHISVSSASFTLVIYSLDIVIAIDTAFSKRFFRIFVLESQPLDNHLIFFRSIAFLLIKARKFSESIEQFLFFFLFNVRVGMFLFNTEFPRIYLVFITHHSQHLQQNVIDCGKYKILFPFRKSILNYLNVVYIKTVHKSYIRLLSDPFNMLEPPSCSFRSTRNCSKQTFLENSRQCRVSFCRSDDSSGALGKPVTGCNSVLLF